MVIDLGLTGKRVVVTPITQIITQYPKKRRLE
jgi:hypothetical protein